MATLIVVQEKGWSPKNTDQYQFHIVLGEKLRSQMKNVKRLEEQLETLNEKYSQSEKDLSDMKIKLKQEEESNADLEDDLDKKDTEINLLKTSLGTKISELEKSETFGQEKFVELVKLKEHNIQLTAQLEEIMSLEKQGDALTNDHIGLDEELSDESETDVLKQDIEYLKNSNQEKERMLQQISDENDMTAGRIIHLERMNSELKDFIANLQNKKDENSSIGEELESLNFGSTELFECDICGKTFGNRRDLKTHEKSKHKANESKMLKEKYKQLFYQITEKKLEISEKLLELKEKELTIIETCRCMGRCKINHGKHNWTRRFSGDLQSKLRTTNRQHEEKNPEEMLKNQSCNSWGLTFLNSSQLPKHMRKEHENKFDYSYPLSVLWK